MGRRQPTIAQALANSRALPHLGEAGGFEVVYVILRSPEDRDHEKRESLGLAAHEHRTTGRDARAGMVHDGELVPRTQLRRDAAFGMDV